MHKRHLFDIVTKTDDSLRAELTTIQNQVQRLQKSVARLEQHLELAPYSESSAAAGSAARTADQVRSSESWESKIGEFWLARAGVVVLLLGIAFLVSYPFEWLSPAQLSLAAYVVVAGVFALAYHWDKKFKHLANLVFGGGLVLVYFVTLKLHFLTTAPVLTSKALGLAATVSILAAIFYFAIRRGSAFMTSMFFLLSCATSTISDTDHFALALLTLVAVAGTFVLVKYRWQMAFVASMVLVYLTELLWMFNNPLIGRPVEVIPENGIGLAYLFAYGALFALPIVLRRETGLTTLMELAVTTVNALGVFVVASLAGLLLFPSHLPAVNLLIASFFLAIAALSWVQRQSKYGSAINACFGYLGLSVAIFTQFQPPHLFIWLAWQSLLVISTAIWFRSRIIIVVNSLIYSGFFLAYLKLAESNDFVNLSYAAVGLISARILNWKQERLELKTDMIRNAYLATALIIVLYGLYHAVPSAYVSISWLGAALFYFGMSVLLSNRKYRWLTFLTILAVVSRVLLIDMASLGAGLRIVMFLVVGSALLVLSLFYAKRRQGASGEINSPTDGD